MQLAQDLNFLSRTMRLAHPEGSLLLFLPCLWGHIRANQGIVLSQLLLLASGALWARSLGCLYNDWIDRPFDRHVTRTALRPFVQEPFSWRIGIPLAIFITGPGLFFLFTLPPCAILIGFSGVAGTSLYPFLKRWTKVPQIFLGIIFNLGIFMAQALSYKPLIEPQVLSLYIFGLLWTVEYDTIYGYQDYKDDQKLGLKSLPLFIGQANGLGFLYALHGLRYSLLGFLSQDRKSLVLLGSILILSLLQLCRVDPFDSQSCKYAFVQAPGEGFLISAWLL